MRTQLRDAQKNILPEIVLFLAGLLVFGAAAIILRVPGYMDAEYYYMNGQRLAAGEGFTEMVIWNYLDNPQGLPHPSHAYWLPLTSLTSALGMYIFKNQQFFYAQIPFIILACFIPPVTYRIGLILYTDRRKALLAGILGLFSGYYLAYQTTTSTIGLYMLEGGLFFWLLLSINRKNLSNRTRLGGFIALGGITGLMHLTRSDGILWLIGAGVFAVFYMVWQKKPDSRKFASLLQMLLPVGMVLIGYLLIMSFWFAHNLSVFGRIMPPGGMSTLWLQDYNQMFSFPADQISFSHFLQSGIADILSVRLKSSWDNLMTLLAVEGEIVLLPLLIAGVIRLRKIVEGKFMLLIWLLTFVLMSWVFPFAGNRGGFFHSSAAFQPFVWAMIPAGFDQFIQWGVSKRNWKTEKASLNFSILLCSVLVVFTFSIYFSKVIGRDPDAPVWQKDWINYVQVEQALSETKTDIKSVIVVNNPPGYYLASGGRPAIVLPDGDDQTLKSVVEKFDAKVVAIDRNIVDGLKHLYTTPASSEWLEYLFTAGDTRIYLVRGLNETP